MAEEIGNMIPESGGVPLESLAKRISDLEKKVSGLVGQSPTTDPRQDGGVMTTITLESK